MKKIESEEEIDQLKREGKIGSGTSICAKFALKQKVPVFVGGAGDKFPTYEELTEGEE